SLPLAGRAAPPPVDPDASGQVRSGRNIMRISMLRVPGAALIAGLCGLILVGAAVNSPAPPQTQPKEHQSPHDAPVHHSFDDPEVWSKTFDDPERDSWQKPAEVVRALGLKAGMVAADLGAGTGYFSRFLSEAVSPGGMV